MAHVERKHDLDWLRFIAIALLLFFHTGMWFTTWGWHVKNDELSTTFNYWMIWSHDWRMPLLLFISGAGTYMALGKRTLQQYSKERFKRLFIPLVFGMFIIVPPQIFYERIGSYTSYFEFYPEVFNFVPYPMGSFSWHHLWFIAYLFVYSLLLLPLMSFIRSTKSQRFRAWFAKRLSGSYQLLFIPATIMLITQVILRPYFPDETHDFTDLAYFVYYLLFFLFGLLFYSEEKIWLRLGKFRLTFLWVTLLSLLPYYIIYMHFRAVLVLPFEIGIIETTFDVLRIYVGWFTILTIISFGQHYLNRPHPILPALNKGLYPFYILHQTVIIMIGYYVCQLDWSIAIKYWLIAFLTLLSCIVMYLTLIKPFKLMRILFGMKE